MKHLTLKRIREVFPHFNERPVTEADFWRACKQNKVYVLELPLQIDGYYEIKRGKHFILLNNRLRGVKWLHTALHEFSHYLFDVPAENGHGAFFKGRAGDGDDPREKLAEAFALTCLMPFPDLVRIAHEGVAADDPWLLNLAGARVLIRTHYGW